VILARRQSSPQLIYVYEVILAKEQPQVAKLQLKSLTYEDDYLLDLDPSSTFSPQGQFVISLTSCLPHFLHIFIIFSQSEVQAYQVMRFDSLGLPTLPIPRFGNL
jgi:hypothetical protein